MRQKCDPISQALSAWQGFGCSYPDGTENHLGKLLRDTEAQTEPQEVRTHWPAVGSRHQFFLEIARVSQSSDYSYLKLKCLTDRHWENSGTIYKVNYFNEICNYFANILL